MINKFVVRTLASSALFFSTTGIAPAASAAETPTSVKTVRFVAFGDFGTGSKSQYDVARAIKKHCEKMGCDFALTLGDNIYNNGVRSVTSSLFQSHFEKPYADLNMPFYMVLGNHDYRGNIQAQLDYTHRSKKWRMPAKYYTFRKGPVTFLGLDTNIPGNARQNAFVKSVVEQHDTPWLLAFGHHPRKTYSAYKNTQSRALKQLIDHTCGEAQFYLSGHEHDQQHLKAHCGTDYLIAGTGAGRRKNGRGKDTLYSGNQLGFAWFEITPKTLHFAFVSSKNQILYEHTEKLTPKTPAKNPAAVR